MVGALAIAMFVALVGFGGKYFGWSDPNGKVQLALATSLHPRHYRRLQSQGLSRAYRPTADRRSDRPTDTCKPVSSAVAPSAGDPT